MGWDGTGGAVVGCVWVVEASDGGASFGEVALPIAIHLDLYHSRREGGKEKGGIGRYVGKVSELKLGVYRYREVQTQVKGDESMVKKPLE